MNRQRIASGAPWESIAGYSRAVRVGPFVHVAGTTAVDAEGRIVAPGDAAAQSRVVFDRIRAALTEAGADFGDVVRTRMFVTDIADWEAVARVHGEIFADIRPAATLVEVQGLIDPGLVVEIEVDAIIDDARIQRGDRPKTEH